MVVKEDMDRIKKEDRGPEDLTLKIEMLTKQKEYLQSKCREAGEKLNSLTREFDKVVEENTNLKVMMKR
jgi:prefoldin subunit 5|tara:strand:- start:1083 stop:1289 length:207 start_codon:yes stop_codon:yes gene_type:complete